MINESVQEFIRLLLVDTVIPLLVPVVVAVAFQFIQKARSEVEARITIRQRELLYNAVAVAVRAAEQAGLTGAIKDEALVKLDYATRKSQELLNNYGVTGISTEELRLVIEAAVREGLHKRDSELLPVLEVSTIATPE